VLWSQNVSLLSFIVHLRRFENNSMDNNEQPNGLSHKKKRPRVKEFQADLKREKAKNGAPPPPQDHLKGKGQGGKMRPQEQQQKTESDQQS
jgi:hypothetical protein